MYNQILKKIEFFSLLKADEIEHKSWIKITAKVKVEFAREYKGKGPVLYPISLEKAEKPATQEEELVYFN